MPDFSLRYGDTLKVHTGQLTSGVDEATKLPKPYTPPPGAALRMVVRTAAVGNTPAGARIAFATTVASDGTWSRAWTTADFTAMSAANPVAAIAFDVYLEVSDVDGKKITFPDDANYSLSLLPAF